MKKAFVTLHLASAVLCFFCSCAAGMSWQLTLNDEKGVLREGHPRLILTEERLVALKLQAKTDTLLQRYVRDVLKEVDDSIVGLEPLTRNIGRRDMLHVSRNAVNRIYHLAFAWRWTGDGKYAEEAKRNLLAVAAFEDWNPRHFLDVAEMTHAVAIGYDWMFNWLDEPTREIIRQAIVRNGLDAGMTVYDRDSGFHKRVNNWNQVCNFGLTIGALAVADTDPQIAKEIITRAVASLPLGMEAYNPEGVCVEGPSYWHYMTRYTVYGLAALQTALGTEFGMADAYPGFRAAGYFPITVTGPTGYMLSYADCKMNMPRSYLPPMLWLASRFENPDFSESEHDFLSDKPALIQHVLYYTPRVKDWRIERPLDKYMNSIVEIACMRSGWDKNALFAGMKGGTTQVSHVQLDMGNFEIDALGERWMVDLGADSYSLPGYFDFRKQRWDYYRNVTRSHNLPFFNDKDQSLMSTVRFNNVSLGTAEPFVTMQLDSAYRDQCSQVSRGIRMVGGRKAVLVQDEFTLREPGHVNWGVMTTADLRVNGNEATFTLNGKKMVARILTPAGAVFNIELARQLPPQAENIGINRLAVNLDGQTKQTITVLFSPVWDSGTVDNCSVSPLAEWK